MRFQSEVGRFTSRASCLAVVAVIEMCVLSTAAFAQTQPMPVLPPEEPVTVDPASPGQTVPGQRDASLGTTLERRRQPWEYGLGVGAAWDSNIDFQLPDGPSGSAIVPRGNLAYDFQGTKGGLRLGTSGYWVGYLENQDRYNATISLEGTYRSSLNTTWQANGSYEYGFSSSSTVLADQGVLLPAVPSRTASVGLGVTRRMSTRTSLRLDGRAYSTSFDEEETSSLAFVDGRSIRGTAALDVKVGSRDTTAIVYSLESVDRTTGVAEEGTSPYLTHFGSLQWTHVLTPRSAFMLDGGSSYTPDFEQAGLVGPWSFYGGASYYRKVKRSDIALFARREVAPAFGLGVSRLETRLGLSATTPMGAAWTLAVAGSHVLPETPEGADYSFSTSDEASMNLGRRLGRLFEISAEARYRRRSATSTFPAIESFQAGLFVSLLSANGRSSMPRLGQ